MLVPMAKVEIIGPKNLFFDVVGLLHEEGKLHIEDLSRKIQTGEMPLDRMEVYSKQQDDRERMEEMLIRARAILKALPHPEGVDGAQRKTEYERLWKMDAAQLASEVNSVIEEVEDKTSGLAGAHASLEAELALLARYEPILHKIQPLAKQIVTTGSFESVALLFERRYKSALDALKEELDRLTHKQCEIVSTDVDEDTTAAIVVFSKAYSEPVHKFLAMENVNQIRLPSEFDGMPFDAAYDAIKDRRNSLPKEADSVAKELHEMSDRWFVKLSTVRDVLIDKVDEISAIPKFGRTEYAFVVEGWLPATDLKSLENDIKERWGNDIIVNQVEISEAEFGETPVALKNASYVKPFQTLIGAYGIPKYGTVDPTFMLFVFYPLFFGMIVGDIGYGLIMLGIVLWLRFKFRTNPNIQIATAILGPAATSVIAFGFLYREFFGDVVTHYLGLGDLNIRIGPLELPFAREELLVAFMLIAIAVGVVQVILGLVIGIVNGVRTKHKSHVYEKGGMLAVLVSALLLGLAFIGLQDSAWALPLQAVAALAMFLGFIYAIKGGGIIGGIESILQFSNIASYIRIMAVGLAGAIFANAVNGIVSDMASGKPLMIIPALIVGILLHGLNFIIAAFSPTIHALRLNFLEFFGKFYETGKQEYKPFQKTGGEKSA